MISKEGRVALVVALAAALVLAVFLVQAAPRQCRDGTDNDGDGLTDYPSDPGCSGRNDNTETSSSLVCDNGSDASNDADTLADYRLSGGDPGCTSTTDTSEIDGECDDLSDNDGDGSVDLADAGCSGTSDSDESNCGDGVCEGGETSSSCSADCGSSGTVPGNSTGNTTSNFTSNSTSNYTSNSTGNSS